MFNEKEKDFLGLSQGNVPTPPQESPKPQAQGLNASNLEKLSEGAFNADSLKINTKGKGTLLTRKEHESNFNRFGAEKDLTIGGENTLQSRFNSGQGVKFDTNQKGITRSDIGLQYKTSNLNFKSGMDTDLNLRGAEASAKIEKTVDQFDFDAWNKDPAIQDMMNKSDMWGETASDMMKEVKETSTYKKYGGLNQADFAKLEGYYKLWQIGQGIKNWGRRKKWKVV
jgi:hypothetical protein